MPKRTLAYQTLSTYVGKPLAYLLVSTYMLFETLWEAVSDWLFTFTPLRLFSERIHQSLESKSAWLVLAVFLAHFVVMQSFALASTKMLLSGRLGLGVACYLGKGLIAIPTFRFFSNERDRLLQFGLINTCYQLTQWVKRTQAYQTIAGVFSALKPKVLAIMDSIQSTVRRWIKR